MNLGQLLNNAINNSLRISFELNKKIKLNKIRPLTLSGLFIAFVACNPSGSADDSLKENPFPLSNPQGPSTNSNTSTNTSTQQDDTPNAPTDYYGASNSQIINSLETGTNSNIQIDINLKDDNDKLINPDHSDVSELKNIKISQIDSSYQNIEVTIFNRVYELSDTQFINFAVSPNLDEETLLSNIHIHSDQFSPYTKCELNSSELNDDIQFHCFEWIDAQTLGVGHSVHTPHRIENMNCDVIDTYKSYDMNLGINAKDVKELYCTGWVDSKFLTLFPNLEKLSLYFSKSHQTAYLIDLPNSVTHLDMTVFYNGYVHFANCENLQNARLMDMHLNSINLQNCSNIEDLIMTGDFNYLTLDGTRLDDMYISISLRTINETIDKRNITLDENGLFDVKEYINR